MKRIMRKIGMIIIVLILMMPQVAAVEGQSELSSTFEEIEGILVEILDDDPTATNCREKLVPIFDAETVQFFDFLDQTFKNKSSTSSLANIAIAKFRLYKKELEAHFLKIIPRESDFEIASFYTAEFSAYEICSEITDVYVSAAKQRMMEHIKTTNAQKKTTMLAEKYKSINGKLRDFDFEVAQMYAFYLTFKNKLPGFLSECVSG